MARVLLIAYNNADFIAVFPENLAYLAAVAEKAGHEVEIYTQDMNKWPDSHLTKHIYRGGYDFVGLGMCGGYYQWKRLKELSNAINSASNRKQFKYVVGGHMFATEPELFINKFGIDHVFIGESDLTFPKVLSGEITDIVVQQEIVEDLDTLPFPAYHLFPMEYYRLVGCAHRGNSDFVGYVSSARGCKFSCNFCFRMTPGYRVRSIDSVIMQIKYLQQVYGINHIDFNEELLMGSEQRTTEVCNAIIKSGLKFKWQCDGRLNFAKPHILKLMKESGCCFINYGIEAFDDTVLKNMHKGLTCEQVIKGVEATLAEGITPGLNIIFGNFGDNLRTLQQGVDFLLKYNDGTQLRTIRPVTGYPGTEIYDYLVKQGKIKGIEDFYERVHKNSDLFSTNVSELTDDEAYSALCEANITLTNDYYSKQRINREKQIRELYTTRNANFRGYRQT